jgi:hypothetical protein
MLLRVPLVEFRVWFWWVWFSKPVVGNVIDILVTCDPNTCHSHNSDNIFNVADTMTGSQSWSHEGKIPQHDICKASTKLACQRWMSSSVTRGMIMMPTGQQTSSWQVATSVMVTKHVSKNWGSLRQHDTDISN